MPARLSLDIWPALPLIVRGIICSASADSIVAALGHSDRVCEIYFRKGTGSFLEWDKVLAAMQVPFPALTDLLFDCEYETGSVIPDTLFGGSAPRLRNLYLENIPFPGIPNLLSSATHLANLDLHGILPVGYVSPEAMASCLSVSTRLHTLTLKFLSSRPRPDRESRPLSPMTHFILPRLTSFSFQGASEYLDYLVARIDVPRLRDLSITFLDHMKFDTPHLVQFISRTPRFREPNEAHVGYDSGNSAAIRLSSRRHCVEVLCKESDDELSSIAEICTKCLPPLLTVENLRLGRFPPHYVFSELSWYDDVDQWLNLLRPFNAVKSLYLSEEFQPNMVSALEELVGDRTTEVLPSLQNIFLTRFGLYGRFFQVAIGEFVAARQLSGHPIAVLPL